MIFHVVVIDFPDGADADIDETFRGAVSLRDEIPELAEVRCGRIDPAEGGSFDALYTFGFARRSDFESFSAHPAFQRYIDGVLPLLTEAKAYNYAEFDGAGA